MLEQTVPSTMADHILPRTPSPQILASPAQEMDQPLDQLHLRTNGHIAEDLTPPPSSLIPEGLLKPMQHPFQDHSREHSLASPPPTVGPTPAVVQGGLFGEIPSTENIDALDETQLRKLVSDMLLPALGEARMSAAHFKLQHSLLSIENAEFMQRAAVEQKMTHREMQVLQDCAQGHLGGKVPSTSPRSPHVVTQKSLDVALERYQYLQKENAALERRLQKAKKLLGQRDAQIDDLEDRIQHLRHRIRQNRDHFNVLRASGNISVGNTPAVETPAYRYTPKTPVPTSARQSMRLGSQNAFNALLIAGEVMSGEAASLPSTPTPSHPRVARQNHVRGAHSMSSLQSTPARVRPATTERSHHSPSDCLLARSEQGLLRKHSRSDGIEKDGDGSDSTISVSDHEEAYNELSSEIPVSQASQKATSMLRHSMNTQGGTTSGSAALNQAKITGHVRKPFHRSTSSPRKHNLDQPYNLQPRSNKKMKHNHTSPTRIGLGIGNIPSSAKML